MGGSDLDRLQNRIGARHLRRFNVRLPGCAEFTRILRHVVR
jgi:hypothetical protein